MIKDFTKRNPKALVIAAFTAVYLIWGSTYLAISIAVKTISPFFMAGVRFLVAGFILLIWALLKGEKFPDMKSILKISLSGILLLVIGNASLGWVEEYIPSGLAAIIVATVPLWFVLLDKRQWKFYFSNRQIIFGLVVGFAGVIILFSGKSSTDLFNDKMKLISLCVLLIGTISWTIGSLYSKYQKIQGSTLMKVSIQMLSSSIIIFISSFAIGEHNKLSLNFITWQSIAALAYLIVMGSLVAYMAYMWLLSVRPASVVGTYAYVNPVVAVFLGWLIAKESISFEKIIGLVVIIAGLVIVNLSKEKKLASATYALKNVVKLKEEKEPDLKETKVS